MSNYCMSKGVFCDMATDFGFCRVTACTKKTIEAKPAKRGKWIKADTQQYFRKHYPCFTCSACGYRKDNQKKWDYCPNCGADMRGESE